MHLVTIRTEQACYFLRPSKDVNKIIGGVIARYQEIFKVEIFALNVLSNHPHMMVRAPLGNLDEFMENVDREIARRLNYKLKRRGRFWSRRYRAQALVTEKDIEEAFLYIVTNAVKHGLVSHPSEWPGLNSYQQNLTERKKGYSFHHYSAKEDEVKVTYHDLTMSPLPALKDLPKEERIRYLNGKIDARVKELAAERQSRGQGFMGVEKIKAVHPFDRPMLSNHSPAGGCYSKNPKVIRGFNLAERARRHAYSFASQRFRMGDLTVVFPSNTFKPPLHRKPRMKPFVDLPEGYFEIAA